MSLRYVIIEVCDANPAAGSLLYTLESDFPGVSILETACMSECDLCARFPYVFIDGELIHAATVEELVEGLRQRLDAPEVEP